MGWEHDGYDSPSRPAPFIGLNFFPTADNPLDFAMRLSSGHKTASAAYMHGSHGEPVECARLACQSPCGMLRPKPTPLPRHGNTAELASIVLERARAQRLLADERVNFSRRCAIAGQIARAHDCEGHKRSKHKAGDHQEGAAPGFDGIAAAMIENPADC